MRQASFGVYLQIRAVRHQDAPVCSVGHLGTSGEGRREARLTRSNAQNVLDVLQRAGVKGAPPVKALKALAAERLSLAGLKDRVLVSKTKPNQIWAV